MLNVKWMGFRRQVDGTTSKKTILFHTDTTFIDRPIDSVASPFETLLQLFGCTHRWLAPSIRLSLVYRSFVVCSSFICLFLVPYLSLFIY